MFSTTSKIFKSGVVVRAFTTATTTARSTATANAAAAVWKQQPSSSFAPRFLSSSGTPTEPDTSVVDVCTAKIKEALGTDQVKVVGAYDDPNGSHISIEVISEMFQNKRPVQRQQLVYKALWEELQGPVHAVDSMVCKTPDE
jgi:acid stress-induced BolA-like protein IbaG/YrbA